jgi:hypothetical protein
MAKTVSRFVRAFATDKKYWDIRILGLRDHNAMDQEAHTFILAEVFYENDLPRSWKKVQLDELDSFNIQIKDEAIKAAFTKHWLGIATKLNEAVAKPILYDSDFSNP